MKGYRDGRFSRGWRRMRVWALGGVTTLGQALAYDRALCGHSLDQREEVRSPHALLRPRDPLPPTQGSQVREQHRRVAPREPHALPGLLQDRPPHVAVEGAADIGATVPLPAQSAPSSTSTSDLEAQEPRRLALEQGPPRQLALDQGRRRYPPSMRFQDELLFVLPSQ
ncbi:unnamed protein product [Miscanthus lutarioriparius]|uniref:Uncharacterized protein n=1 Tax=Miscanthus lutarioriparius TaxID=422564 RepID=A0A811ST34_9POAL|nr:unnamed protein product [Miscanthus lutarioriparius]CAD6343712.1 unnamed protein product [Miscanthus lutarioriparius]